MVGLKAMEQAMYINAPLIHAIKMLKDAALSDSCTLHDALKHHQMLACEHVSR
jgi:hypothetical protein